MKKSKFAALLALLSVCAVGTLASCGGGEEEKPTPTPTPEVPEVKADFTFTGKNTIKEVEYDCTLKGFKDGKKFELAVGTVKTLKGTYEFVEGEGYKFKFANHEEVVETTWNETTKSHELVVNVKLGDLGSGDVKVTLKDEDFVLVKKDPKEEFIENAVFTGVCAVPQMGDFDYVLTFTTDGKYHIAGSKDGKEFSFLAKDGTYTYENNVFTFKVQEQSGEIEYKSVFDPLTGIYTIPYVVYNDNTIDTPLTFNALANHGVKGSINIMGANLDVIVTVNGHGKAFLDVNAAKGQKPSLGGMDLNAAFDKTGTYTYNMKTNTYSFSIDGQTFDSTFDKATGLYSLTAKLKGHEGVFEIPCTGKDLCNAFILTGEQANKFATINFDLVLLADGKAIVKAVSGLASMDGKLRLD